MNYNASNLSWAERARIAETFGEKLVAEAFYGMVAKEKKKPYSYIEEALGCIPNEGDELLELKERVKTVFEQHYASKALRSCSRTVLARTRTPLRILVRTTAQCFA